MPRGRSWHRDFDPNDPRHSPDWYEQAGESEVLITGDRMFITCEGGPCNSRLEYFPPRLEVATDQGTYVLIDIGVRAEWRYVFVPRSTA
jgi:hypothetical protein